MDAIEAQAGQRGRSVGFRRLLEPLAAAAVTLFGLLLITFVIGRVIPIDPVMAIVGERASQEVYERVRAELRLDEPILEQFVLYLGDALRGDFGTSVLTGNPVLQDVWRFFPATVELATVAILIGALLGVPAGVIGAVMRGRWPDHLLRFVSLAGYSVPLFWLGLVGLLIFYLRLDWVGGPGRIDLAYQYTIEPRTRLMLLDTLLAGDAAAFASAVSHLVLPAGILGFYSMAYIARMARSLMLEQLSQEYITTARVKGLSEARIIWRHAFPNMMVPILTVIALTYAFLLEGAILVEAVFAWPGIGLYIVNSVLSADMAAVLGATIVIGTCFVGLNMLSDLLYAVVDPRTRPS